MIKIRKYNTDVVLLSNPQSTTKCLQLPKCPVQLPLSPFPRPAPHPGPYTALSWRVSQVPFYLEPLASFSLSLPIRAFFSFVFSGGSILENFLPSEG